VLREHTARFFLYRLIWRGYSDLQREALAAVHLAWLRLEALMDELLAHSIQFSGGALP
jgi:hypothetical protein